GAAEFLAALCAAAETLAPERSRPGTVRAGDAIAVHIDVAVAPAALEAPDERLAADLLDVLPLAKRVLCEAGFAIGLEGSNAALFVRLLPSDEGEAGARKVAIEVARTLAAALAVRPLRDDRVEISICLHAGRVVVAGDIVCGGELTRLATWLPDRGLGGLVGTEAALGGLDIETEAITGSELRRVPITTG